MPEIKLENNLMKNLYSFPYLFWFSYFLGGCQARRGSKLHVLKCHCSMKSDAGLLSHGGKAALVDENLDIYVFSNYLKHV